MPDNSFIYAPEHPPCFTEETRTKLKQIKETRLGGPPADSIDWCRIWEDLEFAARLRNQSVKYTLGSCSITPGECLDKLGTLRKKFDELLQELQDPHLIDWFFYSEDKTSWLSRCESPRRRYPVINALAAYRDKELTPLIEELKEFTSGRRTRVQSVQDCENLFLATLIEIGHELFGPGIGDEDSPLIEFVSLAAESVMGSSAPAREALRSRARRQAGLL